MSRAPSLLALLSFAPFFASAQTLSAQGFIAGFLAYVNTYFLPFLFGFAFLFFVINAIRFFVINGSNEDGRKNAKNLAIYGVLAFVVLIVFWGVVNLLASSIGLSTASTPTPDYLQKNGTTLKRTTRSGETATKNSPCDELLQQFDNEFGGPCATNEKTGGNESNRQFFEGVFDDIVNKLQPDGSDSTNVVEKDPVTAAKTPEEQAEEEKRALELQIQKEFEESGEEAVKQPCNGGVTRGGTRC